MDRLCPLLAFLDEVGDALGDHYDGGVGVGPHYLRHHGGIDYAEIFQTVNSAVLVDHRETVGIRSHFAGNGSVPGDAGVLLEPGVQRVVVGQIRIRRRQPFRQQTGEARVLEKLYAAAHRVAESGSVPGIGQELEIEVWLHRNVIGGQGQAPFAVG